MSMPEFTLLITALLFGMYAWLSGLELGVALLRLSKNLDPRKNQSLFTPVWEITNMIMVFAFVAFGVFFNNVLPRLDGTVFGILAVTMTALLARACLVLYMYHIKSRPGVNLVNLLFVVCSALVPLGFAAIGVYLLTGRLFWYTHAGWTLFLVAKLGLLSLAASFVLFQTKRRSTLLRLAVTGLTVTWAAFGTLALQHVLPTHLLGSGFVAWTALLDLVLLYTAVLLFLHREQHLWIGLSIVAILAPIVWALTNLPYLVFPGLLTAAYGAQAYDKATLIGLAVVAPFMILGAVLFIRLYTTQPRSLDQPK